MPITFPRAKLQLALAVGVFSAVLGVRGALADQVNAPDQKTLMQDDSDGAASGPDPTRIEKFVEVGEISRRYLIHVPPNKPQPMAAIIVLHGVGGLPEGIANSIHLDAVADREGFATIYPEGIDRKWADIRSPDRTDDRMRSAEQDMAFITALTDALVRNGTADPSRLYLAGFSNGGFMATTIACWSPGKFAAFATISATASMSNRANCKGERPLPLIAINGTADSNIFWLHELAAPLGYFGSREFFAFWAQRNGCAGAEQANVEDSDPSDHSDVTMIRATNCRPGSDTELYRVEGGGHNIPTREGAGSAQPDVQGRGAKNHDIETAEEIWAFFKRFSR